MCVDYLTDVRSKVQIDALSPPSRGCRQTARAPRQKLRRLNLRSCGPSSLPFALGSAATRLTLAVRDAANRSLSLGFRAFTRVWGGAALSGNLPPCPALSLATHTLVCPTPDPNTIPPPAFLRLFLFASSNGVQPRSQTSDRRRLSRLLPLTLRASRNAANRS